MEFLVKEKGFKYVQILRQSFTAVSHEAFPCSEERVRRGAEKLSKFLNAKQQGRLDGFFTAKPKASPPKAKEAEKGKGKAAKGTKRKVCVSYARVPLPCLC